MICPICNCQMQELKLDQPCQDGPNKKFEFYCKKHGDYELKLETYYIRDCKGCVPAAIGPWHQIITPAFALNWFEHEQQISVYRISSAQLFLREQNKSLQDFLNLYHRLNNLKVFL